MLVYQLFLACTIVVVAFLGAASAEYQDGHSLHRYTPQQDYPTYKDGDSLHRYTPQQEYPAYKDGHSLHRYTPQQEYPAYKDGHSLHRYTPQQEYPAYKDGHSLHRYTPQQDYPSYKEGHSLHRDSTQEDDCGTSIKIQGMIYCKDNGVLIPMQGATARVTCRVKDTKNGYETTPLSVETTLTDKKGYFLISMSNYISPPYSISKCRVFLDEAASEYCYVPTNSNNGISGAHLSNSKSRRLDSDGSTLYSVGPFAFKTPSY